MTLQTLPPAYQDLLTAQNKRERDALLQERLQQKVENAMDRLLESRTTNYQQFKTVLDSAVKSLKCDKVCVDQCVMLHPTFDEKATCLDMCMCFATPEEKAALRAAQMHFGTNQMQITAGPATATMNQPMNGLVMNQSQTSYDAISAMVLFGGLLLIAFAVYHMAQKNKK